jgi:hypothetical protein
MFITLHAQNNFFAAPCGGQDGYGVTTEACGTHVARDSLSAEKKKISVLIGRTCGNIHFGEL